MSLIAVGIPLCVGRVDAAATLVFELADVITYVASTIPSHTTRTLLFADTAFVGVVGVRAEV